MLGSASNTLGTHFLHIATIVTNCSAKGSTAQWPERDNADRLRSWHFHGEGRSQCGVNLTISEVVSFLASELCSWLRFLACWRQKMILRPFHLLQAHY